MVAPPSRIGALLSLSPGGITFARTAGSCRQCRTFCPNAHVYVKWNRRLGLLGPAVIPGLVGIEVIKGDVHFVAPMHASMAPTNCAAPLTGDGTRNISDKIVGMFDADRYSDQSRRNADGAPCFFRQPGMYRRRRVTNQ
jgi:hypothetical protein